MDKWGSDHYRLRQALPVTLLNGQGAVLGQRCLRIPLMDLLPHVGKCAVGTGRCNRTKNYKPG